MRGTLIRQKQSDHGTEGVFTTPGFACFTMEPPWRDNQRSISCIPPGEYDVVICHSPKYNLVYWVKDVPGRSVIRIHSGNFGGDVSRGLATHTNGCILLGHLRGSIRRQSAVLNSRWAIDDFMSFMNYQNFRLNITER